MLNVTTKLHKNTLQYQQSYFNEVSDEENNEIIREIEKLNNDDFEIVKSEVSVC